MLKLIQTDREKKGGGKITRFVLELPWFSVWIDLCEAEMAFYDSGQFMAEMLNSELSSAAHKALTVALMESFSEGTFETVGN